MTMFRQRPGGTQIFRMRLAVGAVHSSEQAGDGRAAGQTLSVRLARADCRAIRCRLLVSSQSTTSMIVPMARSDERSRYSTAWAS